MGTGIRGSGLWGKELHENYGDVVEFVGLCDVNAKRMEFVKGHMGVNCPVFTDFDTMIKKTSPDTVIVTTVDCFHAKYICRAMELGCDGVLMNTAIAAAQNPILMASAMRKAIEAGREAYLAGRMPARRFASASSPIEGMFF